MTPEPVKPITPTNLIRVPLAREIVISGYCSFYRADGFLSRSVYYAAPRKLGALWKAHEFRAVAQHVHDWR